MKRLILLAMGTILFGAIGGNSFEFSEKSFGPLEAGKVGCESPDMIKPYSDLIFEERPRGDKCFIRYSTERKIVRRPDGGGRLTGTRVRVSARKYKDQKLLLRNWANPETFKYDYIKENAGF